MQIENVFASSENGITATINGITYSYIPRAAIIARDGEVPRQLATWLDAGNVLPKYVLPPLTTDDFAVTIQAHVDATAKSKGYADGVALAGYSVSTIPAWAAEAAAFIAWRDQVWMYVYTEFAKVQDGKREVPVIAELVEELPKMVWPT